MNIAVLVQDKIMQGLHRLIGGPRSVQPVPLVMHGTVLGRGTKVRMAGPQHGPVTSSRQLPATKPARPLRVLRVVDRGLSSGGAGRLVISGRMADVCAELDRLAACEAAALH